MKFVAQILFFILMQIIIKTVAVNIKGRIKFTYNSANVLTKSSNKIKFWRNNTTNNKLLNAQREEKRISFNGYADILIFNCTQKNFFALTWDDGPWRKLTEGILDLLKLKNATATFFIVANRLLWEPYRQVAQRALKEGHQIASHSWNHENLNQKVTQNRNCTELKHQVLDSDKLFRAKLGVSPKFFRPPYGKIKKEVAQTLKLWDYYIALWNLNTFDYKWKELDKLYIVEAYNQELKNEDPSYKKLDSYISLQHDISRNVEATIERYSYIIDLIREKGYKLVTMGECVGKEDDMYFKKKINYKKKKCIF
jgi:peptidoglycan/xylan/chitin deacetylase (PgdA/CDA1 family)